MFGWRRKEDVLAGSQVLGELEKLYAQPRKVDTLHFRLILASEKPSELHVADTYGDTARLYGDIPEIPQKSPLTQELVSKSMQKLGGTVYTCGSVILENPDRLFLSSAQCNALRRKAVEAVDCLRIGAMRAEYIYVSEKQRFFPAAVLRRQITFSACISAREISLRRRCVPVRSSVCLCHWRNSAALRKMS